MYSHFHFTNKETQAQRGFKLAFVQPQEEVELGSSLRQPLLSPTPVSLPHLTPWPDWYRFLA